MWGLDQLVEGVGSISESQEDTAIHFLREASDIAPVFYSLGNFISGQIEAPRLLGGMAKLTLTKADDGTVSVTECGVVPVVTHYSEQVNDGTYCTYRLSEYTQELLELHGIHKRAEYTIFTLEDTWELARRILGEYLIE